MPCNGISTETWHIKVGKMGVDPITSEESGFTLRRVCRFATYPHPEPRRKRSSFIQFNRSSTYLCLKAVINDDYVIDCHIKHHCQYHQII